MALLPIDPKPKKSQQTEEPDWLKNAAIPVWKRAPKPAQPVAIGKVPMYQPNIPTPLQQAARGVVSQQAVGGPNVGRADTRTMTIGPAEDHGVLHALEEPGRVLAGIATRALNPYGIMDIKPRMSQQDLKDMRDIQAKGNQASESDMQRLAGLQSKERSSGYNPALELTKSSLPAEQAKEFRQSLTEPTISPRTGVGKFLSDQIGGLGRMGVETAGNFTPGGFATQSLIQSAIPYTAGDKDIKDLPSDLPEVAAKATVAGLTGLGFQGIAASGANMAGRMALSSGLMVGQQVVDAGIDGQKIDGKDLLQTAIIGGVLGAGAHPEKGEVLDNGVTAAPEQAASDIAQPVSDMQVVDISDAPEDQSNLPKQAPSAEEVDASLAPAEPAPEAAAPSDVAPIEATPAPTEAPAVPAKQPRLANHPLTALTVKHGIDMRLNPEAHTALSDLDGYLSDAGVDARITSGRRDKNASAVHKRGGAIDMVAGTPEEMKALADQMKKDGFHAQYEEDGHKNYVNGQYVSTAHGNHIHVTLRAREGKANEEPPLLAAQGSAQEATTPEAEQETTVPNDQSNGTAIESESPGGSVGSSPDTQHAGVHGRISSDGEDQQDNAEVIRSRLTDFSSDLGDQSIREGRPGGIETPESGASADTGRDTVGGQPDEHVAAPRTRDFVDDPLDHLDSDFEQWEKGGQMDLRPESDRTLSDHELASSLAPTNAREATLQYLHEGGKLSKSDAIRDVFGTHLTGEDTRRNYLNDKNGRGIDDFVHNELPDRLGITDFHDLNADTRSDLESQWRNDVHDVIQDAQSSKHARELLVDGFRKQTQFTDVDGVPAFDRSNKDSSYASEPEGDTSFDFGANVEGDKPETANEEPTGESGGDSVGINNESTGQIREEAEMPPKEQPDAHTIASADEEAKQVLKDDPRAGDRLIDELHSKARPISDTEDQVLSNELRSRVNDHRAALDAVNNAVTDPERMKAKTRLDDARKRLESAVTASDKAGTENARGLNARKAMLAEDFSLENMVRKYKAEVNSGKPLTPEQHAKIEDMHKEIADLRAKLDESNSINADRKTEADYSSVFRDFLKDEDAALKKAKKSGKIREYLKSKQAEDKEFFRKYSQLNSGIDPEYYARAVRLGASYIAEGLADFGHWAKQMIEDIGEKFRPELKRAYEDAKQWHAQKIDKESKDELSKARNSAKETLNGPAVFRLYRAHLNAGVEPGDLATKVTEDLQQFKPGITEREVKELFSDYGKVRYPSKDMDLKTLRELRAVTQKGLALEDVKEGKAPKKSGAQRDKPSQEVRELGRKLQQALKEAGIKTTDPDKQLATRTEANKTRLKNQIEDLTKQIETGTPTPQADGTPAPIDAETKALTDRRDALKAAFDAAHPEIEENRRLQSALSATRKSIAKYTELIEKGAPENTRGEPIAETPELNQIRSERDNVRKQYQDLRYELHPDEWQAKKNEQYREQLRDKQAEVERRIRERDFTKPDKKVTELDKQSQTDQIAYKRAQNKWADLVEEDRLKNRTKWQKVVDAIPNVRRAELFTSPSIFGKLGVAAVVRQGFTTAEEALGTVMSVALKGLADRASRGGALSVEAEKAAYGSLPQGLKDSMANLFNRESDLETMNSDRHGKIGWLDAPAHLHAAVKAPIKRMEYERSVVKRTRAAERRGEDTDSPAVQERIAKSAYQDAKRAIYMQENALTKWWAGGIKRLENGGHTTSAAIMNTLVPVVSVPTNMVIETTVYAGGWVSGPVMAARAYMKGIETLSEDQADQIYRHLEKGAYGAALLMTGFLSPNSVGGFYQKGEDRDGQDAKAGSFKIGDWDAPAIFGHTAPALVLQLGATLRHVYDDHVSTGESPVNSAANALVGASQGLAGNIPLMDLVSSIGKAMETPNAAVGYVGEIAKSFVMPGLVQNVASWADPEKDVRRTPSTFMEHIEMGIPGLRENVPIREKQYKQRLTNLVRTGRTDEADALGETLIDRGIMQHKDVDSAKKLGTFPRIIGQIKVLAPEKALGKYEHLDPDHRTPEVYSALQNKIARSRKKLSGEALEKFNQEAERVADLPRE